MMVARIKTVCVVVIIVDANSVLCSRRCTQCDGGHLEGAAMCESMEIKLKKVLIEMASLRRKINAALKSDERRKTVRAKRPAQQRKVCICQTCKGAKKIRIYNPGGEWHKCEKCHGTGKRQTVAYKEEIAQWEKEENMLKLRIEQLEEAAAVTGR
jgi:hypothetical protein